MKKAEDGYRIGDLASMFGLTARTVRYYEELGLLKSSDRNEGIHRRYPDKNIALLKRIKNLKTQGLSLGEIKEFFDLAEQDLSGELCKVLLIGKYEGMMRDERAAMDAARLRLDELSARAEKLKGRDPFFSCPGPDCEGCEAYDSCKDNIELKTTAKATAKATANAEASVKAGER